MTASFPYPTATTVMTAVHLLLCAALFFTCFCRAVRSDCRVDVGVRVAFNALGAVACWGMAAPLTGWQPDAWSLAILAAIVYTQWITARHWSHGVPEQFIRPGYRPTRRRATDFAHTRSPAPAAVHTSATPHAGANRRAGITPEH